MRNGKYLLVLIDDYSRYLVVKIIRSTAAKTAISELDDTFASMGIPNRVRSDNGPPFNSH